MKLLMHTIARCVVPGREALDMAGELSLICWLQNPFSKLCFQTG